MYTIQLDGRLFYDPRIADYALNKPTLTLEANKHGTLSFTVYPAHPEYHAVKKTISRMAVYRDKELICLARPTYVKRTFRNGLEYKCEEVTAWLNDFMLRPGQYDYTVEGFFGFVLDSYNARADSQNAILLGRITCGKDDEISYKADKHIGFWDALKAAIVNKYTGYLVPRYEGNQIYLDFLNEEDLPESTQQIIFGENLTDLFIETDTSDTFSILIPTGADYDAQDETGKTIKKQVTIESVNDGKDYITSQAGYAICGWREMQKQFPEAETPEDLLKVATEYLENEAVTFSETVKLSAIDLHNADVNVAAFRFLTRVTAKSSIHDLSGKYVLSQIAIPLGSPESAPITLGDTARTLTDRIVTNAETAASAYTVSELQTESDAIRETTQEIQKIVGTDASAALRIGKATRDGTEMDAIILNDDWIFKVGEFDLLTTLRSLQGG